MEGLAHAEPGHSSCLDEDLVHDVGAGGDHRLELVAVDGLSRARAAVPGQRRAQSWR
jgi:hypothetical protein